VANEILLQIIEGFEKKDPVMQARMIAKSKDDLDVEYELSLLNSGGSLEELYLREEYRRMSADLQERD